MLLFCIYRRSSCCCCSKSGCGGMTVQQKKETTQKRHCFNIPRHNSKFLTDGGPMTLQIQPSQNCRWYRHLVSHTDHLVSHTEAGIDSITQVQQVTICYFIVIKIFSHTSRQYLFLASVGLVFLLLQLCRKCNNKCFNCSFMFVLAETNRDGGRIPH